MTSPSYDTDLDLRIDTDPDVDTGVPSRPQSRQERLKAFLEDVPRPISPLGYVSVTVALVLTVGLTWLLITMLSGLVGGLVDGVHGMYDMDPNAGWLPNEPIIRTITTPVHTYLAQHAGGLPADNGRLFTFWVILTIGLWAFASVGARGARIGWVLIGALSTAMVYAATAPAGRDLAAGVTVAVWAVMSLTALRRRTHRSSATVINPIPTPKTRTRADDVAAS